MYGMRKKMVNDERQASIISSTVQNLYFSQSDIVLHKTPLGILISMKNFNTSGQIGAPALPHKVIRVAIPKGHSFKQLKIVTGPSILLNHKAEPVACIQKPAIGFKPDLPSTHFERSFVLPDSEKYQNAMKMSMKICRFIGEEMIGLIPCVLIDVWPIRFTRDGLLELIPEITLTIISAPSHEIAEK
jgi:hypothetical protein